jgi:signal transduction histidine kinase
MLAHRVELYAGMPTKLSRLFKTPTMQDSVRDTLLWMNEAYALADAPRYLLDSFDKSSIRWSDVDAAGLVRSVLDVNKGEIRRRGLRVQLSLDEMRISADPEFLKIVIFNLIDNAVKYSFQKKYLRVELRRIMDNRLRFEVENVGVYINPEDRDRIFDPWVRSFRQYLTTRRPGTGLGLAVSQRILHAHDEATQFNFTSEIIGDEPRTARTMFYFEMNVKGKVEGLS